LLVREERGWFGAFQMMDIAKRKEERRKTNTAAWEDLFKGKKRGSGG